MAKMKKGDKKPNRDIKEGDLVLEITPVSGPLKTNLKGPFLVVRLNHSQNIALLKTGHTQQRVARYFKRHTSHLVKYHEKPPAGLGEGDIASEIENPAVVKFMEEMKPLEDRS